MSAVMDARKLDVATDLQAEQSVLGILLRNSELIDDVGRLRANHFYISQHRLVFESIERIEFAKRRADPIAVYDDLRSHGVAKKIDGRDFLFKLLQNAGSDRSLETHASIVRERALLRSIRLAAGRAQDIATNSPGKSAASLLDAVQNEFAALSDDYSVKDPVPVYEVFKAYVDRLDRIHNGEEDATGVPSGLEDLDQALNGGFKPGKLYIVGARPSMGKTALALCCAAHQSLSGFAVGYWSLEMPEVEIVQRLIAVWGGMDTAALDRGNLSQDDWTKLFAVAGMVEKSNLHIDDEAAISLGDLTHRARSLKRKKGLDILYVDYLQLMEGDGENRNVLLGSISRGLKRLAKSLGIPVVALSQLNREVQKRIDRRPVLSDLRESGDIEQDADVVMMPYREAQDNPDTMDPDLCEVFIRKQRGGACGVAQLKFEGKHTRFVKYHGPSFEDRERMKSMSSRKKGFAS